jgi:uncharacterized membrane protein YuzA (DUF378 family)
MASRNANGKVTGLQFSPWNLLLILPLAILITPLYNFDKPRLFGLPFFYWSQLAFVLVGVGSVWVVYVKTRDVGTNPEPAQLAVDDLDEGAGK